MNGSKAVLWDMDGTLINSEELHWISWRNTMANEGVVITREQFLSTFGQRNDSIVPSWLGSAASAERIERIAQAKEELYRHLVRRVGIAPEPGVASWLHRLHKHGWQQAIASAAPRANIDAVLEAMSANHIFQGIVSAEDVHWGKPDPEVYLLAASRVGVPAERCIVVEDAVAGIEGARRAGMRSIGVSHSGKDLHADVVVESLELLEPYAFDRLLIKRNRTKPQFLTGVSPVDTTVQNMSELLIGTPTAARRVAYARKDSCGSERIMQAEKYRTKKVKKPTHEAVAENNRASDAAPAAVSPPKRARWEQTEGTPLPLGATWIEEEQAFNFAVYAEHAESVTLLLYSADDLANPIRTFEFNFLRNKSGRIWHCRLPLKEMRGARYYAYSVSGQVLSELHKFDPDKVLLDPYAKSVFFPPEFDRNLAIGPGPNAGKAPLGVLTGHDIAFDWSGDVSPHRESDAIIYELHVKGFTKNPNSGVHPSHAGTYSGLVEKIPYLQELGITVVELMPIFQRDPHESDYWGYMPLNFFAPQAQYASTRDDHGQHLEFRRMVKALHRAGIAVVIDVVYNHTCEGDHRGPTYSLKGFDPGYYMPSSDPSSPYANYSGTGNTLNFSQAQVRKIVLDSLRYWKEEMHIDGFRFDLASVFSRNIDGTLNWGYAPIFSEISGDPELGRLWRVALIAEPWDVGGYQLGRGFPGVTWLQWNARFRDDVRRFVKGDAGMLPDLMRRIYGSDDLFPDSRADSYHPFQSVNYINSHDGFTLYDLVSYNRKHNWKNGHNNQDGMDENYSWNCGHEGDEGVPADVMALRRKQVKNFCCLLLLSNGIPMFRAGDEFLNTQFGNNNPYSQDNEISWLDWSLLQTNQDIFRFFKGMIAFRKSHPSLCRSRFWREEVSWYATGPTVDLSPDSRSLAFCLDGASQSDDDIYVMINAYWQELQFQIQESTPQDWLRIVDTSLPSPDDFSEHGLPLQHSTYQVAPRSIVVLVRPKTRGSSVESSLTEQNR